MHAVPAMCLNHQVPQHQGGDKKQELSRDKHMTWITAKMEFSTYQKCLLGVLLRRRSIKDFVASR